MHVIYIANSTLIEVTSLRNAADDAYVNSATVNVTITDKEGTNVTGETWPVTLNYVAASNGVYQGVVAEGIDITANERYIAKITATFSGDQAQWSVPLQAKVRQS